MTSLGAVLVWACSDFPWSPIAELTKHDSHHDSDPALLDDVPMLPDLLTGAPASLRQRLYQAFDLQMLYGKETHQVSFHAVITPSTSAALAALINDSEPPSHPASSDSLWTPIRERAKQRHLPHLPPATPAPNAPIMIKASNQPITFRS